MLYLITTCGVSKNSRPCFLRPTWRLDRHRGMSKIQWNIYHTHHATMIRIPLKYKIHFHLRLFLYGKKTCVLTLCTLVNYFTCLHIDLVAWNMNENVQSVTRSIYNPTFHRLTRRLYQWGILLFSSIRVCVNSNVTSKFMCSCLVFTSFSKLISVFAAR